MSGRLVENTALATLWLFVRVFGQVGWFVIIARTVGSSGFGLLAGLSGAAVALGGLCGIGTGMLLLKQVSVDPSRFSGCWGRAEFLTLVSGVLLALAFVLVASYTAIAPAGLCILAAIALSEILCAPYVTLCSLAFQAHERLGWCAALPACGALVRMSSALAFHFLNADTTIESYAVYHVTGGVLMALMSSFAVRGLLRPHAHRRDGTFDDAREGLGFSALWFSNAAIAELDKTLALRFGGPEIAGIYAAAYRLTSIFTLPTVAFVMSIQPSIFRGGTGMSPFLRKAAMVVIAWSMLGIVALNALAGVVPMVLGPDYTAAARAVPVLAWMLPFQALRVLGANILAGQGFLAVRGFTECAGLVLMIVLSIQLVPDYGVSGAAAAVIAAELSMAAIAWTMIVFRVRRWERGGA
jgi:O-antigen/teichoic acid export membrane protein